LAPWHCGCRATGAVLAGLAVDRLPFPRGKVHVSRRRAHAPAQRPVVRHPRKEPSRGRKKGALPSYPGGSIGSGRDRSRVVGVIPCCGSGLGRRNKGSVCRRTRAWDVNRDVRAVPERGGLPNRSVRPGGGGRHADFGPRLLDARETDGSRSPLGQGAIPGLWLWARDGGEQRRDLSRKGTGQRNTGVPGREGEAGRAGRRRVVSGRRGGGSPDGRGRLDTTGTDVVRPRAGRPTAALADGEDGGELRVRPAPSHQGSRRRSGPRGSTWSRRVRARTSPGPPLLHLDVHVVKAPGVRGVVPTRRRALAAGSRNSVGSVASGK